MEKSFEERVAEAQAEVISITPKEANECKTCNPGTIFIDPRSTKDISTTTGIIPGALNMSLDELSNKSDEDLAQVFNLKTRPIIASCQGGPMGALAAHALKQRGFDNVFFIEGGTQGWLDAGYTTAK
ncbi:MAG: rhodanese-like domain-containing protein [Gammaproteobacteria bacterium]|nr:rhodanese-like domain-containing protein [Gammaproteobacteria bacterium]